METFETTCPECPFGKWCKLNKKHVKKCKISVSTGAQTNLAITEYCEEAV